MPKKMTKEEFIAKAEARYGKGKYSFDEVDYQGSKIKVKIHCNICGEDFWKRPNDFLSGSECYCQNEHITPRSFTQQDFINKAISIYGPDKYGFDRVNYVNNHTPVEILCNCCGNYFLKTSNQFLQHQECSCQMGMNTEKYIKKALDVYGPGIFDYSITEYKGCTEPIEVIDIKTGLSFWTYPKYHLEGHGSPVENESGGETLVRSVLNDLNIQFIKEFSVVNKIEGRNINHVKIDFEFIYGEQEYWIEYNGIQHYNFYESFWKRATKSDDYETNVNEYKYQLQRDKNVRDYCKENGIILIEIPYTYKRYDVLKPILEDIIFNGKSPEDLIVSPEIENYKEYLGLD